MINLEKGSKIRIITVKHAYPKWDSKNKEDYILKAKIIYLSAVSILMEVIIDLKDWGNFVDEVDTIKKGTNLNVKWENISQIYQIEEEKKKE